MGRPSRVWLVLPLVLLWLLLPGLSDDVRTLGVNLALIAVPAVAGVACFHTARRRRRAGTAQLSYWLLGAACLSWATGNVVWTALVLTVGPTDFVPSLADPFYLALIPLTAAALLALPHRARGLPARLRRLADSLIVATSLFVVGWPLVVLALMDGMQDPAETAVALAYPAGDFVLLTLAIPMALGAAPRWRGVMVRLCLTLLPLTAADIAYCVTNSLGTYTTTSLVPLGWLATFCAVTVFALRSPSEQRTGSNRPAPIRRRTRTALALFRHLPLLAAAGTALALLFSDRLDRVTGVAVVAVLVLTALRQQLALWENGRLTSELESRVDQRTQQLAVLAYSDPLTGLANRALFGQRLRDTTEHGPVLLLLDLDGFKAINDTLGHAAGDELLTAVAGRLRDACDGADVLARLGGDEFAVLLLDSDLGRAEALAEVVLTELSRPFAVGHAEVRLGASIGIAGGDTRGDDLLRDADLAMYAAKAAGRNCWRAFDPAMGRAAERRRALEDDLRLALEHGQLSLAWQPVVDLDTDALIGAEALLRWEHPEHGSVPPDVFVLLAEETGLIGPIGDWVLEQACRQGAEWIAQLPPSYFAVGVNLSVHQLQPNFVRRVADVLTETGLQPSALILEVTESVFMDDERTDPALLQELRSLGPKVFLDDFGTGYSSLSYLQRFPVDGLKIDRSFVRGLGPDSNNVLAEAVLRIAGSLDLLVVAEGIEHEPQRQALVRFGCRAGQGFGLHRPMTAAALTELLSGRSAAPHEVDEAQLV